MRAALDCSLKVSCGFLCIIGWFLICIQLWLIQAIDNDSSLHGNPDTLIIIY